MNIILYIMNIILYIMNILCIIYIILNYIYTHILLYIYYIILYIYYFYTCICFKLWIHIVANCPCPSWGSLKDPEKDPLEGAKIALAKTLRTVQGCGWWGIGTAWHFEFPGVLRHWRQMLSSWVSRSFFCEIQCNYSMGKSMRILNFS